MILLPVCGLAVIIPIFLQLQNKPSKPREPATRQSSVSKNRAALPNTGLIENKPEIQPKKIGATENNQTDESTVPSLQQESPPPELQAAGNAHLGESEVTTNSVEDAPQSTPDVSSQTDANVLPSGWQTRGARLQQGRKLSAIGSRLMGQRRYAEAAWVLKNAEKAFPPETNDLTYGETLFKLGMCLRKTGRPEQAIPVLRQAMRFPLYRTQILREYQAAQQEIDRTNSADPRAANPK